MRRLKSGETITVTEHGKTIGQIIPVRPTTEERLKAMAVAGQVAWDGGKPQSYQSRAVNRSKRQLADLVAEDRE
jgi:antitoxin (DNA-binding transcriptional repressor) of toxin-antitoxin stability system